MIVYEVTVACTVAAADEDEARSLVADSLANCTNAEWRSWDIESVEDTGRDD